MSIMSFWATRLGLLLAGLGLWLSFMKGDGPAPNWSFLEQVGQSAAAAVLCGLCGAGLGLVFDLMGMMFRRSKKFSKDMRDMDERVS